MFKVLRKYVKYSLPKINVNNIDRCVIREDFSSQVGDLRRNFYSSPR